MTDVTMVIDEAKQMPTAAIEFARGVSEVRTPEHLIPLRTEVREHHRAELNAVHAALYERFNRTSEDYVNVFRAAAEMAVMERVGAARLSNADRRTLRDLWTVLLTRE